MTTSVYRNAFAKIFGGIDTYYTPFITTSAALNKALLKDLLPEHNDAGVAIIPQLLSNNGADFRLYASALVDLGYKEINWNIGCPFPMVTSKKKGSGLLPYPEMIEEFLDITCADSNYSLTVKMRLGFMKLEEGILVTELLNKYPLKGVIIHARTGKQMYTGNVDLEGFGALNNLCKHEVTYNGDVFTPEDLTRICQRFPTLDNFMLGRGALRNPFLPSMIKGHNITPFDKINMIRQFHAEIYSHYRKVLSGDKHLSDKMSEFWEYMSVHLDQDGKFMKRIKKCHTTLDYLNTVEQLFNDTSFTD